MTGTRSSFSDLTPSLQNPEQLLRRSRKEKQAKDLLRVHEEENFTDNSDNERNITMSGDASATNPDHQNQHPQVNIPNPPIQEDPPIFQPNQPNQEPPLRPEAPRGVNQPHYAFDQPIRQPRPHPNQNRNRNQNQIQNRAPQGYEGFHVEDEEEEVEENNYGDRGNRGNGNRRNNNGNGPRMSILDHVSRRRENTGPSIHLPPVPANTSLILNSHIMANLNDNTFSGSELEDAQEHVDIVMEIMHGYNVAGINEDQLMLRVFPKTLTGKAKQWLKLLPPNSIQTWERLKTKFISEFTTPAMINKKIQKITSFEQDYGETLYNAWTRFQLLLRACPQHDMTDWKILDRFYDALDIKTRQTLDGGGPFLLLETNEAYDRLELLARYSQQYHDEKEKKANRRSNGSDEDEDKSGEIRALKAKVEGADRKIEKLTTSLHALAVGCNKCGGMHLPKDCPKRDVKAVTFEEDEEASYISGGQWEEKHRNKSYQGQGGVYRERNDQPYQGNRNYNNTDRQFPDNRNFNNAQQNQPGQQQADPIVRLEALVEKFATHFTKRQDETDRTLRNQQASIHNIEKQVGQIAQCLQERMPGSLPGFTKTNPNAET